MCTKYKKGVGMVKSLEQIIKEKSSSVTTTQERTAGTSNLEIETFYYNEKDYLKGKYYNLSNIVPDLNKFNFENAIVKNKKGL